MVIIISTLAKVVERRCDDYGKQRLVASNPCRTFFSDNLFVSIFYLFDFLIYIYHINMNVFVKLIFKIEFADIFPKIVDSGDLGIQ